MQVYVVSDNEAMNAKIRQKVVQSGEDCPESHVVSLAKGTTIVSEFELAIVVMSPNPEGGILALREMANALGGISLRSANKKRVLAIGPADAKLILRTIREGAQEYLDEHEIDTELRTIVDRIKIEFKTEDGNSGTVISVLAPSGGSGSSTIVCNLATVLAKEHKSVCVFDMKLGAGVLDAMFDLKPEHNLADLCSHAVNLDHGMFDKMLCRHSSGVRLLCPPNNFNDIGYVTPEGVKMGIKMARQLYPYVIIDLDRTYTPDQNEALLASDLVLLVLRLDFTSLRNTRQTLDHLERLGLMRDKVRLVVNRYGQPKEMRLAQAEEALGLKVFSYIPDEAYTINRANNNGTPAVLESPKTKVARALMDLAQNVNGQRKK